MYFHRLVEDFEFCPSSKCSIRGPGTGGVGFGGGGSSSSGGGNSGGNDGGGAGGGWGPSPAVGDPGRAKSGTSGGNDGNGRSYTGTGGGPKDSPNAGSVTTGGGGGDARDTTPTLTADERSQLAWGQASGVHSINPSTQTSVLGTDDDEGWVSRSKAAFESKMAKSGGLKTLGAMALGSALLGPLGIVLGAKAGKSMWGSEDPRTAGLEGAGFADDEKRGLFGGSGGTGGPFADGARNGGGQGSGGTYTGPATGQGQVGGPTVTGAPTMSADQNPIGQMQPPDGSEGYDPEQYWPTIDPNNPGQPPPYLPPQAPQAPQAPDAPPKVYGQTPYSFLGFLKVIG